MKFSTLALLLLMVAATATADGPTIPKVAAGPNVDGDLSDPIWKKAAVFKLQHADANRDGEPANPTTVYVLTDATRLYFGFDCIEKHPDGPFIPQGRRKKDKRIPDHVRVQFSFGRLGRAAYFRFTASPAKEFASNILYRRVTYNEYSAHDSYRGASSATLPSYRVETKVAKGRWTAEMSVALKELPLYPADGVPDLAEVLILRIRSGEDRDKFDKMVIWDEGPVAWRGFWSHVQSWPRIANPKRFLVDHGGASWGGMQPMWFGLLKLDAGTISSKPIRRGDNLPAVFYATRKRYTNYGYTAEEGRKPRLQRWFDTVPKRPAWTAAAPLAATGPVNAGNTAAFVAKPQAASSAEGVRITFTVKEAVDVAVGIVDEKGRVVRHLAAGALGANPPAPLQANTLAQNLLWDRTDDSGKPAAAGKYTARVSLGLRPVFEYVFKDAKGSEYDAGKSQIAQRVGLGKLEPLKWKLHPHGGFAMQICVDNANERVVLNGHAIYDGRTGKYLGEVELADLPRFPNRRARGELGVGPKGNWWITVFNDIRRYAPDGSPLPFTALGSHVMPRILRGNANPNRGFTFGGPQRDCYVVHYYDARRNWRGAVSQIGADGRVRQWGLIECQFPIACVKADRAGNVYVATTARPMAHLIPPNFRRGKATEEIKAFYAPFYGAVVKFSPAGGSVYPHKDGDLIATANTYGFGRTVKRLGLKRCRIVGAKWLRPGFSTITVRAGANHCNCATGRFELDPFERLWIPDAIRSRIDVVDANGNTILNIGEFGSVTDSDGRRIRLGYPKMLAVSDRACYIMDFHRGRALKIRLDYATQAETPIAP